MCSLIVEELDLLGSLFGLDLAARFIFRLNGFDLALQLNHFVRLLLFLRIKLHDALFEVSLTVLCLQLLAHCECYRTVKN